MTSWQQIQCTILSVPWYKIYKKECVFNIHSTIPHKNLCRESEVPFQEEQKMYTTSVKMPEVSPIRRATKLLNLHYLVLWASRAWVYVAADQWPEAASQKNVCWAFPMWFCQCCLAGAFAHLCTAMPFMNAPLSYFHFPSPPSSMLS